MTLTMNRTGRRVGPTIIAGIDALISRDDAGTTWPGQVQISRAIYRCGPRLNQSFQTIPQAIGRGTSSSLLIFSAAMY
jgi:hypothetical protein